jgi:hypothetical protein
VKISPFEYKVAILLFMWGMLGFDNSIKTSCGNTILPGYNLNKIFSCLTHRKEETQSVSKNN